MDEHHNLLVLCLDLLRWLGLSFTAVRYSSTGDLVPTHSKLHLSLNLVITAVLTLIFLRLDLAPQAPAQKTYRSSMAVYPLYTKTMALTVVLVSLCANLYNRKYVDMVNRFRRVRRRVGGEAGARGGKQYGVVVALLAYLGAITGVNLWVDGHLALYFGRIFRVVHHVCFWYVTVLTAQLVVTMEYIRGSFGGVNDALGRRGLGLRGWMGAYWELREAEDQVNEVLGKQVFLTQLLSYASMIVNVYYMVSLNLYGSANLWVNAMMAVGLMQSVVVAVVSTMAAESAAGEANRVNEIVFEFLIDNPEMYHQMKYFTLFNHYYPTEFRVWVFYAINNDSLFKVMLTSCVVITIILQCDFLRGTPP